MVCSPEFAGVERSLTYVAPELARRGHEVTVIGGAPDQMQPPLDNSGVTFVPAATIADAARRTSSFRSRRPDVVHSHMTAADLAAVMAWPLVRAPLVSTLHFAQPRGHTALRREAYRLLPPCFRMQIAISAFVAQRCGTRTVVVPNGVPAPEVSTVAREPIVLVAQRLEPEKQTGLALRAWARSPLRHSGWHLEIAGRGAERAELETLATSLGVAGSVMFSGFVEDIGERMARASILLASAPSEPFGLSVVEAMAAGLPVVAAAGGAHTEILEGFDGQMFRPGDVDSCAVALTRLGTDSQLRSALSTRGSERYEQHFTIEHHVDRLLAVYERMAA
jgi:glycosyltransferase involved in cell wall biosynthesis